MIEWHDPDGEARARRSTQASRLLGWGSAGHGSPTQRMREHVDRILAASAVPDDERDDVSEELYGHLYERWQAAIASGTDATTAARQAIESFGGPQSIGPELTSAYHSRLYASTIGLLLPAGVSTADGVVGYRRSIVILGFSIFGCLLLAVVLAALVPPLPALIGIAGCVYFGCLNAVAIKALGRGQEWAVVFVRLICVIDIGAAIPAALLSGPGSIGGLAVSIAVDLWVLNGVGIADGWAANGRPARGWLVPFVVATSLIASLLPLGALALPDPTQTTSRDLSITVAASCPSSGPWLITARLSWARTDALGGRLLPLLNDEMGLSVGRDVGTVSGFPGDDSIAFDDDVESGGDLVDTSTGATVFHGQLSPGNEWSRGTGFYAGNRRFSLDPASMRAGTTYETTFTMAGAAADAGAVWGGRDDRFRVRYSHLGRWGLEAVAACGRTVAAEPVAVR